MNVIFEFALSTRFIWSEGTVLQAIDGCEVEAQVKFKEAIDRAWGYGWGLSHMSTKLFEDVPELQSAFLDGRQTMVNETK